MENNEQKTFYIFLGTQGSGKSSLYEFMRKRTNLGLRINQDEIILENNFNYTSISDLIKSCKILIYKLRDCIAHKKTFNLETATISNTLLKYIKQAKMNGFNIEVFYICLNDYKTNFQRVLNRVSNGGHKVDKNIIYKNYQRRFYNMNRLLNLSDKVLFFDNTYSLEQIAYFANGKFIYVNSDSKIMKALYKTLNDEKTL